jgi:hypothetical protein
VEFQLVMVPNKPETAPRWVIPLEVYYKPFTILVWLGPPQRACNGALGDTRQWLVDSVSLLQQVN